MSTNIDEWNSYVHSVDFNGKEWRREVARIRPDITAEEAAPIIADLSKLVASEPREMGFTQIER